jgi:hypothetical protein
LALQLFVSAREHRCARAVAACARRISAPIVRRYWR